jgi:23S rRNA (guanosine2251-2'-O)-methyltransferase
MPRGEPILELEALLDNIRSAYNVGSMFRTADGAGIRHLHLCGVTSFPSKHIAAHRRISKTALGAEQHLPWTYYRNGLDAVVSLKRRGYRIWGIEENAEAQSVFELEPVPSETPIVLVMGNELVGIDPGVLEQCDRVLSIPMRGWKESLNVAVAFGVIAYVLRMVYAVNDVQANQR